MSDGAAGSVHPKTDDGGLSLPLKLVDNWVLPAFLDAAVCQCDDGFCLCEAGGMMRVVNVVCRQLSYVEQIVPRTRLSLTATEEQMAG